MNKSKFPPPRCSSNITIHALIICPENLAEDKHPIMICSLVLSAFFQLAAPITELKGEKKYGTSLFSSPPSPLPPPCPLCVGLSRSFSVVTDPICGDRRQLISTELCVFDKYTFLNLNLSLNASDARTASVFLVCQSGVVFKVIFH